MKLLIICGIAILAFAQNNVTLLRWAGPEGSAPDRYEDWIAEHPYTPFHWQLSDIRYGDGRAGNVAIIVESSLASPLSQELNTYSANLQSDGHTVYMCQMSGGTPESLRALLIDLRETATIEGTVLIGNLPVAWYEIANDFNQYGYVSFPIDLFYMDLDGNWLDTMNTGNGRYDGHTGHVKPDIYVGRLWPYGLGNDTTHLRNYFRKNNSFRHDTLLLTQRALVFVDDDWIPWAGQWAGDVSLLYSDTMNYWHPETTRASIYRNKLNTSQAWVSVFAHSSPSLHQFAYNSGSNYDYYYASEYTSQDPPTNFYNHFACSFCRYTTSASGGTRSVFNATSGAGAIGSTKTGSMLDFNYFYRPLRQTGNLGNAFKYWFECIYDSVGMNFMRMCWHYGMTLLADPYLIPKGHNIGVSERRTEVAELNLTVKPNPIRDRAIVDFNLMAGGPVKLEIIDIAGRKIAAATRNLNAARHRLDIFKEFNGIRLNPGVYFLIVETGDDRWTAQIVIL